MLYKKFIFIRDFQYHGGVIKKGTDLCIMNNIIYVNGGQITPVYYSVLLQVIEDELRTHNHEFIKETVIPYNKI